jgi:hypothetical protein
MYTGIERFVKKRRAKRGKALSPDLASGFEIGGFGNNFVEAFQSDSSLAGQL